MMREDRLVLPIPPGVHWKSEMPILHSEAARVTRPCLPDKNQKTPTLMPPTRRGARFGPPPANDVPEPAGGVVEKAKPQKKIPETEAIFAHLKKRPGEPGHARGQAVEHGL